MNSLRKNQGVKVQILSPRQILKHLSELSVGAIGRISNESCLGTLGLPADFAASAAHEPTMA
jgi:hypothetical protein